MLQKTKVSPYLTQKQSSTEFFIFLTVAKKADCLDLSTLKKNYFQTLTVFVRVYFYNIGIIPYQTSITDNGNRNKILLYLQLQENTKIKQKRKENIMTQKEKIINKSLEEDRYDKI